MNIDFSRKLIKGRIAEVIFEQMIREEGRYTVIPFGYEHTVPTLAQYRNHTLVKKVMDNISDAPDFALVSNDKSEVFLVEVKFCINLTDTKVKEWAGHLLKRWNPSWIFIATPNKFYCAPCSAVVENGDISELPESWVSKDRQIEYLKLLNEFENN